MNTIALGLMLNNKGGDGIELVEGTNFTGASSSEIGIAQAIAKVKIPNTVTSVGSYAFYNCKKLTDITIPNSITSIETYAFYGCESLTTLTIPDTVTTLGSYAFYNCKKLESMILPNGITTIEKYLFYRCESLVSVTIPDTVTSFGVSAFYGCKNLADIYYKGTSEQWESITKGSSWNNSMGSSVSGGTTIHYEYV